MLLAFEVKDEIEVTKCNQCGLIYGYSKGVMFELRRCPHTTRDAHEEARALRSENATLRRSVQSYRAAAKRRRPKKRRG